MTSTRIRSRVISAWSAARLTSRRKVFMFTGIISCNTGRTIAPPFKITFSPPKPVRTKDTSLLERVYRRAIIIPIKISAAKITPVIIKISVNAELNI